jgi:eukaryotic-like serine/threonine-protein kinase
MRQIRLIDRGGFGVVHEVEGKKGYRLARKSFDPQEQNTDEREKLRRRFIREVQVQSKIRHPNVMPIIEHDVNASPPWFTMPLASRSFSAKIEDDRRHGIIDPKPWQDILAGVEELHRLGYVHRDLKPANILLVENTWVLSDFGLILPTARETTILTSSGSAYGSHYYAAPEQAQDFRNTPEQADIFALGCILHDTVDPAPARVPFAQIRIGGLYGPLLEKCTEVQPKKRLPSISALRALLFELWRTSQFSAPAHDDATVLNAVLSDPDSIDHWRALIGHMEALNSRDALLRAIDGELIVRLNKLDDVLFGRMIELLNRWAEGTGFQWEYCDVVGDRLSEAYRVSPVRIRCGIALAALELAVSHNRWHVMRQVGNMLDSDADNGLVDRILIEIDLDSTIERKLRKVEEIIRWPRDRWHAKIAEFLNRHRDKGD